MQKAEYAKPLQVDGKNYTFFDFNQYAADTGASIDKLPFSIKILVENLLRKIDGRVVKEEDLRQHCRLAEDL
jgi:aconitate hydratase